jgi:oxygen-independent coproporphyrinogen-3 oxidase
VPEVPEWRVYLDALTRELDVVSDRAEGQLSTLYVGGGTPTLLPPDFYERFFAALRARFDLSRLEEATIETDGEIGAGDLDRLVKTGFNRLSAGIKSFNPRTRDALSTGPPPEHDPVGAARTAGFSSVGLDIIYGIEDQTLDEFLSDIESAVSLGPDHISLYSLEENGDAGPREAEQDISAAMFRQSIQLLRNAGFRHYEITNFSRPGHRSAHNSVYWFDGEYFGLGPSAHSSMTRGDVRVRWHNSPEVSSYLLNPGGCLVETSREGGIQRAREALILGLRMSEGVKRVPFQIRYGYDPVELLRPHFKTLVELGLIRSSTSRTRLTTRGMLLSNEVFEKLI